MSLTEKTILDALKQVSYPGFNRDIVSLGVVRAIDIAPNKVTFEIHLEAADAAAGQQIRRDAEAAIRALGASIEVHVRLVGPGGSAPSLQMASPKPPSAARSGGVGRELIPEVRDTLLVASGKGGVGKSTVAVNLAVAPARQGNRVGLLDADIYGPSIPLMTGLSGQRPTADSGGHMLLPFERFGIRLMSLGFLVDPAQAVIWRGPMVMKAIEQLLGDVNWGPLDFLVVDMPPGTGDAQLTMAQRVQVAGAVIVTTPQDVALADAIKGVAMFNQVKVPVIGLIENMSYFECPACAHRTEIFDHGGGRAAAERLDIPFLGEIPLDSEIRSAGDAGRPIVDSAPDSTLGKAFLSLSAAIQDQLASARA